MNALAVIPPGLEEEGCRELSDLGAQNIKAFRRCIGFEVDMASFYRVNLWARLPFRILREIAIFKCENQEDLYHGVLSSFDWSNWLKPSFTFRVDVSGSCHGLRHSHFSALQVKNALVDLQRSIWGERSSVNLENPDLCLHLHLSDFGAVLSLDGSFESLHKRGYRAAMGAAPLKENLAAGLIRLSKWDGLNPLIDPLCGSATLLIEAASDLIGLAPGLNRSFIFQNWLDFDSNLWEYEKSLAQKGRLFKNSIPKIIGCDQDINIVKQARTNIASAGLSNIIEIHNCHFRELILPKEKGTIVCNPPYGKRIGFDQDLNYLYNELSSFFKLNASGWELWLLSGNPTLTRSLRLKSSRKFPISNGGIDCRWLKYLIN